MLLGDLVSPRGYQLPKQELRTGSLGLAQSLKSTLWRDTTPIHTAPTWAFRTSSAPALPPALPPAPRCLDLVLPLLLLSVLPLGLLV